MPVSTQQVKLGGVEDLTPCVRQAFQQTCKFVEVVSDVEGLVVVAGVLVVYEANVT